MKTFQTTTQGLLALADWLDGEPTLLISDLRKVRQVIRGDRMFESAALFRSVEIAP